MIINLDTGRGTHWVAVKKHNRVVLYFDPFGIQPPKEILKYYKNLTVYYETGQVQRLTESNCGRLCLNFLKRKWIKMY